MSWGFAAVNRNNQILISSDTRNLHFVGKAAVQYMRNQWDSYGGLRHWVFGIRCATTPMPFFSTPTADFYAVASVRQVQTHQWEIDVIRSGTSSSIPEVYVFADPRGMLDLVPRPPLGTNYGMYVARDDGTPSFDSRMSPLAVTGGLSVQPPSNPLINTPGGLSSDYCQSDASYQLDPESSNAYSFTAPGNKPIFFYPSLAQAQREARFSRSEKECSGFDAYGSCIGFSESYSYSSTYWAFYRGAIRYTSGTLRCGWITVQKGCNWTYSYKGRFLGIGVGSGSSSSGTWPYSNETLNLQPVSVISANGGRYD